MKKLLLLSLIALTVSANAATLFYGGDYNGDPFNPNPAGDNNGNGLSDQEGAGTFDRRVYDDFTLATASTVTGFFGNYLDLQSARSTTGYYEIRTGVSAGNGGTLVASGTVGVSAAATGTLEQGDLPEMRYTTAAGSISQNLGAGTYWFCLAPVGITSSQNVFINTTIGENGIGGPLNNGNSFIDGSPFNFTDTSSVLGSQSDWSQGVLGTQAAPEPATMAALSLGLLAVVRRRRNKSSS